MYGMLIGYTFGTRQLRVLRPLNDILLQIFEVTSLNKAQNSK